MIYREFGRTGKQVSLLGMGGNRLPASKYKSVKGMEECMHLVVKAYEEGINYFDIAHTYCEGNCEKIFGEAFRRIKKRESFYIAEKSMLSIDPTESDVRRRIEKTLEALGTEYLDFYNMWAILDMQHYKDVIRAGGPYDGALKAKEEGLIRHICFSAHCTGKEIGEIIKDGRFEGVTLGYNVLNFKFREEGLIQAKESGLGVAVMNPLGGGVIPNNKEKFSFIREYKGQDIAEAALRFVAQSEGVSTVLSGISNEWELKENIRALSLPVNVNEAYVSQIKEQVEEIYDNLCTGCNYCAGCPNNIAVSKLMLSYNQYMLKDADASVLSKHLYDIYGMPPENIYDCIKCGRCERKCTQHLPIIRRIEEINKIASDYRERHMAIFNEFISTDTDVPIGVYAAGPFAKRLFELYRNLYGKIDFNVVFFDSDSNKWGTDPIIEGNKIRPPQDILGSGVSKIIIASEANYGVIYESLKYLKKYGITITGF